ncbi:uncharacterized protein LOC135821210 [Sycon ciliatum]|uniref:uncharacterized protein LOC135821210 n=1 Tax=Sycon ciliatum TaxID=27933 RepID=UPI0031F65F1D
MSRTYNPWKDRDFIKLKPLLSEKMDCLTMRMHCEAECLIGTPEKKKLKSMKDDPTEHNDCLLELVEKGDASSFRTFCTIVDEQCVSYNFTDVSPVLRTLLERIDQPSSFAAQREVGSAQQDDFNQGTGQESRSFEAQEEVGFDARLGDASADSSSGSYSSSSRPPSSHTHRLINDIIDIYAFGEKAAKLMGDATCDKLARLLVKEKKDPVDNYADLVLRHIKVHKHGVEELYNVGGVLLYFADQNPAPTFDEVVVVLKDACPGKVDAVESLWNKAEFSARSDPENGVRKARC